MVAINVAVDQGFVDVLVVIQLDWNISLTPSLPLSLSPSLPPSLSLQEDDDETDNDPDVHDVSYVLQCILCFSSILTQFVFLFHDL